MRINRGTLAAELRVRDMTQTFLAKKAGISRMTINSIMSGKACSEETGRKIAEALGMKLEKLM